MSEPEFRFHRSPNSDKPMGQRVFVQERCIGFVWRSWDPEGAPAWVLRLTPTGPDLAIEPTKRAAAMVLWRIAAVREQQTQAAEAGKEAVPA